MKNFGFAAIFIFLFATSVGAQQMDEQDLQSGINQANGLIAKYQAILSTAQSQKSITLYRGTIDRLNDLVQDYTLQLSTTKTIKEKLKLENTLAQLAQQPQTSTSVAQEYKLAAQLHQKNIDLYNDAIAERKSAQKKYQEALLIRDELNQSKKPISEMTLQEKMNDRTIAKESNNISLDEVNANDAADRVARTENGMNALAGILGKPQPFKKATELQHFPKNSPSATQPSAKAAPTKSPTAVAIAPSAPQQQADSKNLLTLSNARSQRDVDQSIMNGSGRANNSVVDGLFGDIARGANTNSFGEAGPGVQAQKFPDLAGAFGANLNDTGTAVDKLH